ncbi:MFS transporter [Allopusillimonas soli]|uniref:MFS transporter n=1 Tax=Allopusillimonas soli TaxID=659016 RepID=A0A853FHN2_9BURK|nr:MFS transporter [Allopusillimonas soli]NYT37496.1 MFS transporter [Allopusillimonas soli]TEA74527.1 MFS transporter [Allopusillimonas soli]
MEFEQAAGGTGRPGSRQRASPPYFFGPWVVRSAFVLAFFGWGVGVYGPAIYLSEVLQRTGWPLTLVSSALTVHYLAGAMVIAMLPRTYRRIGLPWATFLGAACMMTGAMGWALAAHPWQLFAGAALSGAGWVCLGSVAINAIVSPWFDRGRPRALAAAYNGGSMGGVVFSPLWVALITAFGFAGAVGVVGAVTLLVTGLLARLVFSRTPENTGQRADGDVEPARLSAASTVAPGAVHAPLSRNRAFITLAAAMAISMFAQMGLTAHLFNILGPVLGAQNTGLLLGCSTACAMLGRLAAARAMSHVAERRKVGAASYAVQAAGAICLLLAGTEHIALIVIGVLLVGSGVGNSNTIPPLIAQADFASAQVARVVALIIAISQGSYAFAPAAFGMLQSMAAGTHGETPAVFFMAVAGLLLFAAILLLIGRKQ